MVCGGCGAHCLCWLDKQLFAQINNCLALRQITSSPSSRPATLGDEGF
jgi:hypothetical protein